MKTALIFGSSGLIGSELLNIIKQNDNYKKLPLKSPLQMFACLESNIPHTYTFNQNTQLLVLDVENNTRDFVDNIHPLVLNMLNNTNHLIHGKILQDYISNSLDEHIHTYENIKEEKEEEKIVEEKEVEKIVEEFVEEVKPVKKRGRPKKVVSEEIDEKPKKKRGRPKKNS